MPRRHVLTLVATGAYLVVLGCVAAWRTPIDRSVDGILNSSLDLFRHLGAPPLGRLPVRRNLIECLAVRTVRHAGNDLSARECPCGPADGLRRIVVDRGLPGNRQPAPLRHSRRRGRQHLRRGVWSCDHPSRSRSSSRYAPYPLLTRGSARERNSSLLRNP